MSILQVKNVPDALAAEVRRLASDQGCTLSELVLRALEREIQRHAFSARLEKRGATKLKQKPAAVLAAVRNERHG